MVGCREIPKTFAKHMAASKEQPAPFQVQKVGLQLWIGCVCRLGVRLCGKLVALSNSGAELLKHDTLPSKNHRNEPPDLGQYP